MINQKFNSIKIHQEDKKIHLRVKIQLLNVLILNNNKYKHQDYQEFSHNNNHNSHHIKHHKIHHHKHQE